MPRLISWLCVIAIVGTLAWASSGYIRDWMVPKPPVPPGWSVISDEVLDSAGEAWFFSAFDESEWAHVEHVRMTRFGVEADADLIIFTMFFPTEDDARRMLRHAETSRFSRSRTLQRGERIYVLQTDSHIPGTIRSWKKHF